MHVKVGQLNQQFRPIIVDHFGGPSRLIGSVRKLLRPGGVRNIALSVSVCPPVRSRISENHMSKPHRIFCTRYICIESNLDFTEARDCERQNGISWATRKSAPRSKLDNHARWAQLTTYWVVAGSPRGRDNFGDLAMRPLVFLWLKKQYVQTSQNFLYMLLVAVTQSSFDDNAIKSYVLPVSWRCHISNDGPYNYTHTDNWS